MNPLPLKVRQDPAWRGAARHAEAWPGLARRGKARQGFIRPAWHG
jgi:hypothetical protein